MANFYGSARTNYFKVKNLAKFKKALDNADVQVVGNVNDGELVALLSCGDGGWCSSYWDDVTGDAVEIDIPSIVAKHLKKGWVAVFLEVGAENLRYILGGAIAVNCKNESVYISLDSIYEKAKHLGKNITRAEY